VTFSEEDQYVVISGRRRSSYGKGVRAITHAAFNLALLKYRRFKPLPHPNVVLIDSPLAVYREPDTDEAGFAPELKDSFYRSLASEPPTMMMELGQSISIEDRMSGLFATEPFPPCIIISSQLYFIHKFKLAVPAVLKSFILSLREKFEVERI
jgi:hypothetical protein